MRDYGKIHTGFWSSSTLSGLDSDARLLAVYLLTSQHTTMSGAFRLPDAYACEDLGWDSERFQNGLRTLSDPSIGFIEYDAATKWVWVVKFLQFNKPDNPNQWKAVNKLLGSVPASVSFIKKVFETVPEPFRNLSVSVPVSVPSPEPKSESKSTTLKTYLANCEAAGTVAVPEDDAVFRYAERLALPPEFVALAWGWFKRQYGEGGTHGKKRYTDWRAHFRNAVEGNWPKYWFQADGGGWQLTTAGKQAQAAQGAA